MDWKKFNDNETKEGVEGRWRQMGTHRATFYIYGTNHKMDWLSNFSLNRTLLQDGIRVNTKDLVEAQWTVEYITSRIDMKKVKILTIVGHSRGGGIAQIVAWKLNEFYPNVSVKLVLFGGKRAGNKKFVKSINHITDAYRHRGDIVPFLPIWPLYYSVKTTVFGKWSLNFIKVHMPFAYRLFYHKYSLD